ncbi:hypothetical protein [Elizabethkingia anophelis]|uniref:hypothetical protein n=1 Tax=Elizabethkingia anophelis TaxID=1117645 RepID=UPI0038926A36
MKTKYIAVPVSERLPEKEGCYPIIFKNTDIIRDYYRGKDILSEEFWKIHIEYWLEEKEDHSEEMLSVLSGLINDISNLLNENDIEWQECGYFEEAKKLINTIKNG